MAAMEPWNEAMDPEGGLAHSQRQVYGLYARLNAFGLEAGMAHCMILNQRVHNI